MANCCELGKGRVGNSWLCLLAVLVFLSTPVKAAPQGPDYDEATSQTPAKSTASQSKASKSESSETTSTKSTPGERDKPESEANDSEKSQSALRDAGDLMVKGAYDRAAAILLEFVGEQPENGQAQAQLGFALARQHKLDDADEHFDKALTIDANNAVAHCGKAMVLLDRVDRNELGKLTREQALKQAGRECNKALDADPRVVEAHFLLGTVFKEEKRYDLALQAFSGAIRLDPRYVRAYNMKASVEELKNDLTGAIEDYKQSLSISKGLAAHIGLAEVYSKQSRFEEAMSELNEALAINPDSIPARLALAQAMEARGKTAAAISQYEQIIALKPDNGAAYLSICDLRDAQGEYNMAIEELQAGLKVKNFDSRLHTRLLEDLFLSERIDDLVHESKAGLTTNPDSSIDAWGLAMGYYATCQRHLNPAITSSIDFVTSAQLIASANKRTPNNNTIALAHSMMLALSGQAADLTRLMAPEATDDRLLNSNVLMALRRYGEASVMISGAIKNAGSGLDVMKIGDACLAVRDLYGAEEAYKKGQTITGQDLRSRRGLARIGELRQQATDNVARGKILLETKQYQTAVDKLQDAVVSNPFLPDARFWLAQSLEKTASASPDPFNVVREALSQYQSFVALSPSLPQKDLERAQKRIDRLETAVNHAANSKEGWRSLLQRLSIR